MALHGGLEAAGSAFRRWMGTLFIVYHNFRLDAGRRKPRAHSVRSRGEGTHWSAEFLSVKFCAFLADKTV
jgi:hypothetical protein